MGDLINDPDLLFTQQADAAGGAVEFVFGDTDVSDAPPTPDVALIFRQPSPPFGESSPIDLLFDDDEDAPAPEVPSVTVDASGSITGLRASLSLRAGVLVQSAGVITGLRQPVGFAYLTNVARPMVAKTVGQYQRARVAQIGAAALYQQAQPANTGTRAHWQRARPVLQNLRASWQDALRLANRAGAVYQQALAVPTLPLRQKWQEAARIRTSAATQFDDAVRLPTLGNRQRFQEAVRLRTTAAQAWQAATPARSSLQHWANYGIPTSTALGARYQNAWPPRPGARPRPVVPVDPCYLPTLPALLLFDTPWDSPDGLVFVCERPALPGPDPEPEPGATVVVQVRRVYVTVNTLTLTRASDGALIPCAALGMSLDVDSWTWQWQATLHAEALPLITPGPGGDPVEVLASINGTPYRLAVEGYTRSRTFGSTRIAVRGRGRAAILDAPYAPTLNFGNTATRTAQQLMADVLTINGVGIGWDVDWRLTDWTVPANVWTMQGPYIAGILDIAGAAGGYVQPHNTAQTLRILPRYPAAPWDWASLTPDFELPAAVVAVEGTEWLQKPAYNRVHVSGTAAGVLGEVTRTGTAGEVVAPMATHPLITTAAAARQRGIAELSDTGRQARLSLRLPVLEETGVIKPGAFVRYVDNGTPHLGLVRGTQVEWSRPTLRQVIDIETHPA